MTNKDLIIEVSIGDQSLILKSRDGVVREYRVATAKNGPGEEQGSEKTPRGLHHIRAKIGHEQPENTVFVGRRPTGELYHPELREKHPHRDWILTRILWLSGLEPGRNRLGQVDTMRRYVYIHGCPDEDPMGVPSSHGCIKMRNDDVIELFDITPVYTRVLINE
jgi:lipoprotein-anchoring transpeptidase ErfK/SrfK